MPYQRWWAAAIETVAQSASFSAALTGGGGLGRLGWW